MTDNNNVYARSLDLVSTTPLYIRRKGEEEAYLKVPRGILINNLVNAAFGDEVSRRFLERYDRKSIEGGLA